VHAENDGTMPWYETESLYESTLRAAKDACPNGESLKGLQVVDLGEAGRQEVWQSSTRSISKTIAKHGGMCRLRILTLLLCRSGLTGVSALARFA
jgi:abhydrolase domain-containing protein 12